MLFIYMHKRGQNISLSIINVSKRKEQYLAFLIFNTGISEIIWVDNILLIFTLTLSKIKLILIPFMAFNRLSPESEKWKKINVLTALPRDTNVAPRKRHKHPIDARNPCDKASVFSFCNIMYKAVNMLNFTLRK